MFSLDPEVETALQSWKKVIDAKGLQVVGHSESLMPKSPCDFEECKLGQFLADVYVYHYKTSICAKQGDLCTGQIIGMVNSGAIRADIHAGREFYMDSVAFRFIPEMNTFSRWFPF